MRDRFQALRFEQNVLEALEDNKVRSISEIRQHVGGKAKLDPEDRHTIRYKSGKEQPRFWTTVGNLLTPPRSKNLLDCGFVSRPGRDQYQITAEGHHRLEELRQQTKMFDQTIGTK